MGVAISFDPDVNTAWVDGVDRDLAAAVLAWRRDTRAGANDVYAIEQILNDVGFVAVHVERHILELTSLDRADGVMGLPGWGLLAAQAVRVSEDAAREWSRRVHHADAAGTLRYMCEYLLSAGYVPQ